MGFNPYRKQSRRPGDYVLFVTALLVIVAVLAWAVRG